MIKIAIAGGIGSGKSEVSKILREEGAKVIVADEVNAALLSNSDYIKKISCIFPSVVHNNVINKKELASLVFSNEPAREKLMAVAHPAIYSEMELQSANFGIVFYEIPLLSKCPLAFDKIWYVDSPIECRAARIMLRDGRSFEDTKHIIDLQKDEVDYKQIADLVINNSGELDSLKVQVKAAYCSILGQFS